MQQRHPMVFRKGHMQYLWDAEGRKYTDLLGMNVCISVGHSHPKVVAAAMEQAQELTHCTTMFYHPVPAHFAEELAATMPNPNGDIESGQTHERAYALNRRSVWPKNTNWGLIGDAFHKFPTFIARIRRVNSIIFLYKDFMRLPWISNGWSISPIPGQRRWIWP